MNNLSLDITNKLIASELNNMKQINHPNVVRLHESIYTSNNAYLVMECCNGGSVEALIKDKQRLTEAEARAIF